jgi:hypothetical protein
MALGNGIGKVNFESSGKLTRASISREVSTHFAPEERMRRFAEQLRIWRQSGYSFVPVIAIDQVSAEVLFTRSKTHA